MKRRDRDIVFHGVSLLREGLAGSITRHDTPPSQVPSPSFGHSLQGLPADLLLGDRQRAQPLRRPEKFQQVLQDMLGRGPSSVPGAGPSARGEPDDGLALAEAHPLAALRDIGASALGGIVEADEKFFRKVAQGLAGVGQSPTQPGALPQAGPPALAGLSPARFRAPGRNLEIPNPGLTVTDRAGARRADVLPDRRAESLVALLDAHVGRDAVLCSDGDGAYEVFARARAMPITACPRTARGSSTPPFTFRPSTTCTAASTPS